MRILRAAGYRSMPWRNGGGTTTEIAIGPEDAAAFRYRLSIADVASDGPFSRFEGYDRHIMILEGRGMVLDCGAHGRFELAPLAPVSFSGDWPAFGKLVSGPCRDFNVMIRRALGAASLDVVALEPGSPLAIPGGRAFLYVIAGELAGAVAGDTLDVPGPAILTATAPARLARVVITQSATVGCR